MQYYWQTLNNTFGELLHLWIHEMADRPLSPNSPAKLVSSTMPLRSSQDYLGFLSSRYPRKLLSHSVYHPAIFNSLNKKNDNKNNAHRIYKI